MTQNTSFNRPYRPKTTREQYIQRMKSRLLILSMMLIILFLVGTNISMRKSLVESNQRHVESLMRQQELTQEVKNLTITVNALKEDIKVRDAELQVLYSRVEEEMQKVRELSELNMRLTREPYNLSDISQPSNATAEKIDKFLEGTALHGYGKYYIEAENNHNVNAYTLASLHIWESGWGKSRLFKEKNNGFGWQAYNESFDSAKTFNSVEESIDFVASRLNSLYLQPTGAHYNGKALEEINIKYAQNGDGSPNYAWSRGIRSLMKQMANK